MSVITERVPVADISRQARSVRFGATLLAAVTGILFGAGWLAAKALSLLWLAGAHAFTSARFGWQHAQLAAATPKLSVQDRADLISENERLRAEVARLTGG